MPIEHLRGDEQLVKHLVTTHSPATANAWQQLPYVQLPGEGFGTYLAQHERELEEALPAIEHLPWEDVLFDSVMARETFLQTAASGGQDEFGALAALAQNAEERGRNWFRVTDGRRYLARAAALSPWLTGTSDLLAFARLEPDAWLAVEVWEASTTRPDGSTGYALYPDVSLVRKAVPWDRQGWAHLYPNQACRADRAFGAGFCNLARCQYPKGHPVMMQCVGSELLMATGVQIALETLAYLSASDEYVVEVRPESPAPTRSPREARQAKVAEERPWLRRNLPRYILLDPQRVAEYRPAEAGASAGHHAAPRPHQRRGHWRELRHERYHVEPGQQRRVWVKQAWIGASEWTHEGQRYRVVPPKPREG